MHLLLSLGVVLMTQAPQWLNRTRTVQPQE